MRARLRTGHVRWRQTLALPGPRKDDPPDIYATTVEARSTDGFRLIWFRSSQKAALDAAAREAGLRRVEAELHDLATRLNKGPNRSRAAVQKKIHAILGPYRPCSGSSWGRTRSAASVICNPAGPSRGRRFGSLVPASLSLRSAEILRPFGPPPGPMASSRF